MITMLWKELRENTKWAVLAMMGLAMAEFYALNQQQFFGFYVQDSAPLCKSSFLMMTTFGCAAVGLVLGLVQVLPEQRRDQWAALIHRPVERATIFRGKAVAGLLLYLLATVIPFAACVWYVSTPNHFAAPFTPRMIYPGVADICCGAIYYFAALFVALQRGPWYGTRAFGVLAALSGSFIVTTNWEPFYVAIESTVYLSLALFTAAWGAMLTNGTFHGRPWLARVAALAVVFFGVVAAGDIMNMILNAFSGTHYYFGDQYIVDIDGRPLKQTTGEDGKNTFKDLDGKPVQDERLAKGLSTHNVIFFSSISAYVGDPHHIRDSSDFNRGYRQSETYAVPLYTYERINGETWYYLPHERIFTGFNTYNHIRIGSIGQNGFKPGEQLVQSFNDRISSSRYSQITAIVRFGPVVYNLDLQQRAAKVVFTAPDGKISGADAVPSYDDDPFVRNLAVVVLPDKTEIMDDTGKIFTTLNYDRDVDRWGALELAMKPSSKWIFLKYTPSQWIPWEQSRTMPSYLEQFDFEGHLLKTYTLPPLEPISVPGTWQQYISESMASPAFFYGGMVYEKIGAMFGSKRLAGELHRRLNEGWRYTKAFAIRITIVSVVFAAIAFFWARSRQFSWNRAWAWAGFVLAFNLAGLVTFRLVADWPVLVNCPACGRKRLVNEPTCAHCGAAWPLPVQDGTEIIDEQPELASV